MAKKREVTSDSVKQAEHELKDLEKILKTKRSGLKDGDQPLKGQAVCVLTTHSLIDNYQKT